MKTLDFLGNKTVIRVSEKRLDFKINGAELLDSKPLLELFEISKSFPGVIANDSISLRVMPGEIHALLGENGAGKSTLVKMIYGLLSPDNGSFQWYGNPLSIPGPAAARSLGIGMVFQHFSLFEGLTVLENIALSSDGNFDSKGLEAMITKVSRNYGLPLDPRRYVNSLSVGERQRIEIVRCLLQNPKLLILDEPTSVLTPQEAQSLFSTLKTLAQSGCAILYISHKLHEVKSLCETATILRNGAVVATCDPRLETPKTMAELMVGSKVADIKRKKRNLSGDDRIVVEGLSLKSTDPFGTDLEGICLNVQRGQIVGLAGVAGNGQTELMAALSGEVVQLESQKSIFFDNIPVASFGVSKRRALGACFVPEQRHGHAAIKEINLIDNTLLTSSQNVNLVNKGFLNFTEIKKLARNIISDFNVRTTGAEMEAGSLSGGNLQKFIVGREILQSPGILVISQPTWGVDAGATVVLRKALLNLADQGCAVLIISQDLDEVFEICDRVAVLYQGKLSNLSEVDMMSVEQVGLLMGGGKI
jgi:ABC-type uncharacterized transport system ATPase subunit